VETYLGSVNPTLTGAGVGGAGAYALLGGANTTGFTEATCLTPAYNI
jgi:hypothetical protein